jgi:hypothetical protein
VDPPPSWCFLINSDPPHLTFLAYPPTPPLSRPLTTFPYHPHLPPTLVPHSSSLLRLSHLPLPSTFNYRTPVLHSLFHFVPLPFTSSHLSPTSLPHGLTIPALFHHHNLPSTSLSPSHSTSPLPHRTPALNCRPLCLSSHHSAAVPSTWPSCMCCSLLGLCQSSYQHLPVNILRPPFEPPL